jgi:tripartite-type tricarboxylate transporter receptor subunit TctC
MKEFSAEIVASDPAALSAHVQAEIAKWTPVVEQANIQMD